MANPRNIPGPEGSTMVELLCDVRLPSTVNVVRQGDVISAGIAGSPWGTEEYKDFLIVVRDDPALEQQIRALIDADNPYPRLAYPYGQYDKAGNLIIVSTDRLNKNDPTVSAIAGLNNLTLPILPVTLPASVWIKVIQPTILSVIGDALSSAWGWVTGLFGG